MPILEFDNAIYDNKECIKKIKAHFPYRKFKTFFNRANFLLTNYRETDFNDNYAILESFDGTVFFVKGCNCGYRGHGPSNTVSLLILINVPKEIAEKYVHTHNAVELEFNEKGEMLESKTKLWGLFESRKQNLLSGQVFLDTITYADVIERTMYFLSPSGASICSLVKLIDSISPTNFSYYIGNNSKPYFDFTFLQEQIDKSNTHIPLNRLSFFMVKSELFDIVCLFERKYAQSFINCVSRMLNLTLPFQEVEIGKIVFMLSNKYECDSLPQKLINIAIGICKKDDEYHTVELQRGKQ